MVRGLLSSFVLLVVSPMAIAPIACGGSDGGSGGSKLPAGVRSIAIAHEACSESGHKVEAVDVNNDGKPDIRRVYDGGREICRVSDLNHDGKPDLYEYYDKTGQLRRREADYDDSGLVNAVETYEGGKLARAELDTTGQGHIDTWDTFDPTTGKRTKRERDTSGDGRIDQWWTYAGDKLTIAMDRNGDGRPDPESLLTLGGTGGAPVGDAGAPSTPEAPPPSAAPERAPDAPSMVDAGADGPKRGGAKR